MESRKILLYLSQKHNGDWNKIFDDMSTHKEYDEDEVNKLIKNVKSNYICFGDEEYPEMLKEAYKPPFVLYYEGDISLLSESRNKLAVVGTRKPSEYGAIVTDKLVSELAKDFVIISGLACGIDSLAHQACIRAKGKTIAVLGNGLNKYYIGDNVELLEEIKKNHLVITEYPDDVDPCPLNFPIRNRIIVGLCNTVLIPEGHNRSGTQVTATLMARKGGNVCCVPTRIGEDSICNNLIAEGAYLVETVQDIYDAANVVKPSPVFES